MSLAIYLAFKFCGARLGLGLRSRYSPNVITWVSLAFSAFVVRNLTLAPLLTGSSLRRIPVSDTIERVLAVNSTPRLFI
jgi:hypothetical protein